MYQGQNPSALRSRDSIVNAFGELFHIMPYEEISIKRIMLESDLSRQTFYQIFESKDEILDYCLDELFLSFIEDLENRTLHNLCDVAKLFFTFFDQYKDFIQLLIQNHKNCMLQKKCQDYLQSGDYIQYQPQCISSEIEIDLSITFVIHGMIGMLESWIKDKSFQHLTAHELAVLVCKITNTKI